MEVLKSDLFSFDKENKADGRKLLSEINDGVVSAVFFDPQYRGVLDKLRYGNEGKNRGQARCALKQMDDDTIKTFLKEIDRVLKDSGHLFLWVDKYHLCEGSALDWSDGTSLAQVDMITWDKGRIGMGKRTRRKSEYLIVFQKSPTKAKGYWHDHSIPDVWEEQVVKNHPHTKPVELEKRLIAATTEVGDVVLDPAAGGYNVFAACKMLDRRFLGCDIRCLTVLRDEERYFLSRSVT